MGRLPKNGIRAMTPEEYRVERKRIQDERRAAKVCIYGDGRPALEGGGGRCREHAQRARESNKRRRVQRTGARAA